MHRFGGFVCPYSCSHKGQPTGKRKQRPTSGVNPIKQGLCNARLANAAMRIE